MILDEIAEKARVRVAESKKRISPDVMAEKAKQKAKATEPFRFEKALARDGVSFICEVKKASPSKGVIAEDFDYLAIAKDYEKAGADAISVLTEPDYFLGSIDYLAEIAEHVQTPLLRKDFVVDEYMIDEAKAAGASAVLLICALLDEETLTRYHKHCDELGLSALVEAHDEEEIQMAVRAGARIIGVNNRNLKDFTVDIHNGIRLREKVPKEILFVAESGIKTRENIVSGIDSIFSGFSAIDDDFYEEIEETLIMGDLGIQTTMAIVEDLRNKVKEQHIKDPEQCKEILIGSIKEQMDLGENAYEFENRKSVVLVIGVNGVGKTTSVGKLAGQLKDQGKKVILAAADTFRAAAIEQLTEWSARAGVDIIAQQEGSDPAAVIYDAVAAAKSRKADVLICDTAGRLHNKKNLMEELKKINRIIDKEYPDAYRETLVVLDGTTGQNALAQAKQFMEVADITGIILTKLDGTAKGGIAVAIQSELGIPVKYIGVGEKVEDLQKFDSNTFVNALFDVAESE
mgnify:CR=1 FL=1